jgi:protein-L-isoaspartate(D-aspartate) O-methyltransferase
MHGDARDRMVEEQLVARGIHDPRVLAAMRTVPRHLFVPRVNPERSYEDHPLPIGHGQTISQPFIVAFMTEALGVEPGARVLEVGTGSGYQAAVLAAMGAEVFSIEIVPALAAQARKALVAAGIRVDGPQGEPGVVHLSVGDGSLGWPEAAPFDRIMATAAPQEIPIALVEQLGPEGRLIVPVGSSHYQELRIVERRGAEIETRRVLPVLFVPMTGAG